MGATTISTIVTNKNLCRPIGFEFYFGVGLWSLLIQIGRYKP